MGRRKSTDRPHCAKAGFGCRAPITDTCVLIYSLTEGNTRSKLGRLQMEGLLLWPSRVYLRVWEGGAAGVVIRAATAIEMKNDDHASPVRMKK